MRIAQVAPLYESVPPKLYGGTERVVSWLTEELVRLGHDVPLFASGDSLTTARLVPARKKALRLDVTCVGQLAHHVIMLDQVFSETENFDIVHFHVDYLHFPFSRCRQIANVTTLHGGLDLPDLVPLYRHFRDVPVVSISDAQRKPLPWANWQGTVHHGLPQDSFSLGGGKGGYQRSLGRTSPEGSSRSSAENRLSESEFMTEFPVHGIYPATRADSAASRQTPPSLESRAHTRLKP